MLLVLIQFVDNCFHSFIVLCEHEYILMSNLQCSITNVTSCPLILILFLREKNIVISICSYPFSSLEATFFLTPFISKVSQFWIQILEYAIQDCSQKTNITRSRHLCRPTECTIANFNVNWHLCWLAINQCTTCDDGNQNGTHVQKWEIMEHTYTLHKILLHVNQRTVLPDTNLN